MLERARQVLTDARGELTPAQGALAGLPALIAVATDDPIDDLTTRFVAIGSGRLDPSASNAGTLFAAGGTIGNLRAHQTLPGA
jgi:hypothetical protein